MRPTLVIAATVLLGSALAVAACSSETTIGIEDDGGTSSSGGSSGGSSSGSSGDPDGGSSSGGIASAELKAGNILRVGIAVNDVIYLLDNAGARSIEAVPIAGGTPTKIADLGANDVFVQRGGAVAIYKAIANSQGTLSIWSRAAGLKADVVMNSTVGIFFASTDGTRIAFSVGSNPTNANPTSTNLAVSDLGAGAVTTTAALTGATTVAGPTINLAAAVAQGATPAACPLDIGFVGTRLFAAYCTGTTTTITTARLVTVPSGTPTPDRIDNGNGANNQVGSIRPSWQPDTAGTKVFAITTGGAGRIISNAGVVQNLVANTEEGVMVPDGSAAIYRTTAGALEKHTGAGGPTSLAASGVMGILGGSDDGKRILYYTQVDAQTDLIDARGIDHTVAPVVVTYVATPTAGPVGFNATSTDFVYIEEITAAGGKLKSKPAAGGAEKVIVEGIVSAELVRTGTGAIVYSNPDATALQQGILVGDAAWVDTAVAMSPPQAVATQIPDPLMRLKDKTMIYGKIGTGAGLFKATLP